jgi:hypothetical protein
LPGWITVEIGVKSGKERNKSSKEQSLNNSAASSEVNRAWFSF